MTTAILKKLDEMKDVKGISFHTEKGAIKFVPESHSEKLEKALRIAVDALQKYEKQVSIIRNGQGEFSALEALSQITEALGVENETSN